MIQGVTLPITRHLSPVGLADLYNYCYLTLKALEVLSKSAQNVREVDLWSEASAWNNSKEERCWVEESALWGCLKKAYDFAERSCPLSMCEGEIEDLLCETAQWMCATFAYREFNGTGFWSGEKIIYKMLARLKLNYQWNLKDKFVSVSSGWYPHTHKQHLTIFEMALLAGMNNIRSVRNATYDKVSQLETIKEGRTVLITVPEARRWLQSKKRFAPTEGVYYGYSH